MKFTAKQVFKKEGNKWVECLQEHRVFVTESPDATTIEDISRLAKEHIEEVLDIDLVREDQSVILLLSGDIQIRTLPKHADWYFSPTIEWSALSISDREQHNHLDSLFEETN